MPSTPSKTKLRAILILSFGLLVLLVVTAGCTLLNPQTPPTPTAVIPGQSETPSPTALPAECKPIRFANSDGLSLITFPDGSQVFLGNNTEIDFIPVGYCPGIKEHRVTLLRGEIAIRSLLPDDALFMVFSPEGYKVTLDDTGLVSYNPENSLLSVNCSNGNCTIGTEQQPYVLSCGMLAEFDRNAVLNGPFAIDNAVLAPYGEWLLPTCYIPTPESTPTPDFGATATAACSAWNNEFLLTPCPTFSNP